MPATKHLPFDPKTLALKDILSESRKIELNPQNLLPPFREMIYRPQTCWVYFRSDTRTLKQIFEHYVFGLAAIPAVSGLIGYGVFSELNFLHVLGLSIAGYIASILFLYGAARLAQATANMFDGEISPDLSGKLVVFSLMPYFFAGIFLISPPIAPLVLIGSFSFYLFFSGVSVMTKLPPAKQQIFCLINVVAWLVAADFLRVSLF